MIEINNLTDFDISSKEIKKVAKKVFEKEGKDKFDLSVAFVKPKEIRKANKKYREKDEATDVLSFGGPNEDFLEIIICPDKVKNKDKKKGIYLCLIHGILHTLGYSHKEDKKEAEKMRKKQIKYLKSFLN